MKSVKKIFVLMMVVVMLLSLSACGEKDKGTTENGGNSGGAEGESTVVGEIFEFKLKVDGDEFELPAELSDFKDAGWTYFGNPNPEEESVIGDGNATVEMIKENQRISLTVLNTSGDMRKISECKVGTISCMYSETNDVKIVLPKEITLKNGVSSNQVIDKWGEPTRTANGENENELHYVKDNHVEYMIVFDGEDKLKRVKIDNWNFAVEDRGVVSGTAEKDLSFMENYKAPTELSANYMDYICRINNKLYSFPAPITEFLSDGWEVSASKEAYPAGRSGNINLKKGEYNITFLVKNYAEVEVAPEEVMVTGVHINSEFYDVDFEISGGIVFGMSADVFKSKVDASLFDEDQVTDEITEYSYNVPGNTSWYMIFKNRKLTEVQFEKLKMSE